MKKSILFLSLCTVILSCKKDYQTYSSNTDDISYKNSINQLARLNALDVSSYGHLKFADSTELLEFINFTQNATYDEIISLHTSYGFDCSEDLDIYNPTSLISHEHIAGSILSSNEIVEIGGFVISYDEMNNVYLTIPAADLDNNVYDDLANKIFDNVKMNRIRNNDFGNLGELLTFLQTTSSGYDGEINPNPPGERRFFGREQTTTVLNPGSPIAPICIEHTSWYVFGIEVHYSNRHVPCP